MKYTAIAQIPMRDFMREGLKFARINAMLCKRLLSWIDTANF